MYSRAGITIEQSASLDKLLAVATALALVRVVRVAECCGVELEQLAEVILSKVASRVFSFVDNTR